MANTFLFAHLDILCCSGGDEYCMLGPVRWEQRIEIEGGGGSRLLLLGMVAVREADVHEKLPINTQDRRFFHSLSFYGESDRP